MNQGISFGMLVVGVAMASGCGTGRKSQWETATTPAATQAATAAPAAASGREAQAEAAWANRGDRAAAGTGDRPLGGARGGTARRRRRPGAPGARLLRAGRRAPARAGPQGRALPGRVREGRGRGRAGAVQREPGVQVEGRARREGGGRHPGGGQGGPAGDVLVRGQPGQVVAGQGHRRAAGQQGPGQGRAGAGAGAGRDVLPRGPAPVLRRLLVAAAGGPRPGQEQAALRAQPGHRPQLRRHQGADGRELRGQEAGPGAVRQAAGRGAGHARRRSSPSWCPRPASRRTRRAS